VPQQRLSILKHTLHVRQRKHLKTTASTNNTHKRAHTLLLLLLLASLSCHCCCCMCFHAYCCIFYASSSRCLERGHQAVRCNHPLLLLLLLLLLLGMASPIATRVCFCCFYGSVICLHTSCGPPLDSGTISSRC
jgi:hypothetical protein